MMEAIFGSGIPLFATISSMVISLLSVSSCTTACSLLLSEEKMASYPIW